MRIDMPTSPQRILIIKPSALGDVVHTLPILNLLRRRWPQAKITWLIGSAIAGLIQGHPQLNDIILFDRRRYASWWYDPRAAMSLWKLRAHLRERQFDLVIDLQGLMRSGWLSKFTGAPVRVGFANARELAHLLYTHHVPIETMEQHAIERYLAVSDFLGCGREPVEFNFITDDADRAHVDGLISGIGKYAVILPGTNWPTKRWPVEKFATLVEPLKAQRGLATIIAGGTDVADIAAQIPGAVNLVGKTTLRQLVELLRRSELVIANDSGPMHIAAALGKPLVTIFGPTNPVRTGPYQRMSSVIRTDIPCSPCYSRKCSHVSCMKWIAPDAVIEMTAREMTTREMTNSETRMTNAPGGPQSLLFLRRGV